MNALILMTRIPIAGKTKTRLMDTLSGAECADLHRNFLKDLMIVFKTLKQEMDIYITYTPENSMGVIEDIIPGFINCFPQVGQNLGDRMYNAISKVSGLGYEKVILIGSDIPQIKDEDLLSSFNILDKHDIVLGPTYDGGYYLIGMKKTYKSIFSINKKWGGKSVLESTIDIANTENLTVGLSSKYMDIDTKDDLIKFMDKYKYDNSIASNTISFVREWREKEDEISINTKNKIIYKYK